MERQIVGLELWEKTVDFTKILWKFEDVKKTDKSALQRFSTRRSGGVQ